jgi:acyl-CoA thioester hydrolase
MARVKLSLPEDFIFETEIPVRITDINYGGHLGNDSVMSIIHEARVRFLSKWGYTEFDVCGAGLIQSDAVIVFKSEAFYGDVINVSVAIGDFSSSGCDFFFLLSNRESRKEIAKAKTGIVFYDYERKKLLRVPEKFKSLKDSSLS